jgi:hypothetical protein
MSLLFDGPAGYTLETLFACMPFWSWLAPQETSAPFSKLLKSTLGYTAVVHEEIHTVLVRGDEAVTFVVTEPLDRCLGHVWSPPFYSGGSTATKNRPVVPGGASIKIKPSFLVSTQVYHGEMRSPAGPRPQ